MAARSRPITLRDPLLGRLRWRPDIESWEGRLELRGGRSIELLLTPSDAGERAIPPPARAAARRARHIETRLRRSALEQLLETHNDLWNEGAPTAAREFLRRLTPAALHVGADGSAEMYYDDGELFWGHAVAVPLDADGQPGSAVIVV
jgi:hypothetical protein